MADSFVRHGPLMHACAITLLILRIHLLFPQDSDDAQEAVGLQDNCSMQPESRLLPGKTYGIIPKEGG